MNSALVTIYVTRVLETFNWNLHTIDCMKAKFKRPTEVIKISMLTLECNSRKRTSNCQLLSHWPKKDDIIIHHVFSNTQYFNRKHAQRYKLKHQGNMWNLFKVINKDNRVSLNVNFEQITRMVLVF